MRNRKRKQNIQIRKQQSHPKDRELIYSQYQYGDLRYGNYTTTYCGCSWIALYNAMIVLRNPVSVDKLLQWIEARGIFQGLIFDGLLGAYPWMISAYLKEHGYHVNFGIGKKSIQKKAPDADVWILFYLRRNFTGHYVMAYRYREENHKIYYHFMNQIMDHDEDIRSLEDFFDDVNAILYVGIFVRKDLSKRNQKADEIAR